MTYSYGIAAESTASSPCSNVPIHCPLCPKADPAIWKYFMKVHFEEKHKNLTLTGFEHLWKLSHFERSEMKKIWARRGKVVTKRTKKSKIAPLTISDDHRARIPANPSLSPSPEVDKTAETHHRSLTRNHHVPPLFPRSWPMRGSHQQRVAAFPGLVCNCKVLYITPGLHVDTRRFNIAREREGIA